MTVDASLLGPLAAVPLFFRAEDLHALGFTRGQIPSLVRRGFATRVGRGLYRREDLPNTELEGLLMTARMAPQGIFCLLTALRIHEIGTQSPSDVWIALPNKARVPSVAPWRGRVVRWTGVSLTHGIENRAVLGVRFRVTSPARTVVDCFRYRNKVGLDVALEALRDGVRDRITTVDAVVDAAKACRIWSVMRPYLEGVLS